MSFPLGKSSPVVRPGDAGATRVCPHCKTTILESASICPGCGGHLRLDVATDRKVLATPLAIEGTIRHPTDAEPWEYSVMVLVKNERGEVIARHVVGVGALSAGEGRTFSLSVDLLESRRMRR